MIWEAIHQTLETRSGRIFGEPLRVSMWRTKVPGGWFVYASRAENGSLLYYPDPEHQWSSSETPVTRELLRPLSTDEVHLEED